MPLPETSDSMVNGSLKFGIVSVGVVVMVVLSSLKALQLHLANQTCPFLADW
jgi:hypothetical protein